jgi:hypothetical protein
MKKTVLFLMISAVFLLVQSCDDLLDVNFDAEFSTNMNIDVAETKADGYAFSDSKTLNITDDDEVEKYIDRIKDLEITEIECSLTGIPAGESIPELSVKVDELNMQVDLTNISENSTFVLPVSDALLTSLASYLKDNHQSTITVFGTSTYAPMVLGVKLTYKSKVTASL